MDSAKVLNARRRRRCAAIAVSATSAAAQGEPLISEPRSLTSRSKAVESSREQRIEGENLAGAALARGGDPGQGPAVQHGGHGLRNARRGGGVAFEKIGQAREHDAAHDALGQIVAERDRGGKGLDAGVAVRAVRRVRR